MYKKILFPVLILALAGMACGFNIDIPRTKFGPTVTDQIQVPLPKADEVNLRLSFGAGELTLSPGGDDYLAEGTAKFNYDKLKPEIITEDDSVEIKIGEADFEGFPSGDLVNEWDFKLTDQPMSLDVNAGAYKGIYELGGLSLTSLHISDGAADSELSFSKPNKVKMTIFRYDTGASQVKMNNLANANFDSMFFSGGAGDYTLDFGGTLQQDATVSVDAGFGDMQLIIPDDVNGKIVVDGTAVNVTYSSSWTRKGSDYAQAGEGPLLLIVVKISAGNLTITD